MNYMFKEGILCRDKFNKCGEVYRSPKIDDKQYMFLSCIFCKAISWELETFLEHLNNAHHKLDNNCLELYKEDIAESTTNAINIKERTIENTTEKETLLSNCENDPLDDCSNFLQESIKIEKAEPHECDQIEAAWQHSFEYESDDNCDADYEPQKFNSADESEEKSDEIFNEDEDQNEEDGKYLVFDSSYGDEDKKTSLKRFTKNRYFVQSIIKAYRNQNILWDRNKTSTAAEKHEAFTTILKDINNKFKISATMPQIERIIKRFKLRFVRYLRLRDTEETFKQLWYFQLLKFLEPHLKENEAKTSVCNQLNDDQFLTLLKLLRENECFWNENNIYHTSVIHKQEILKRITNDFIKTCNLNDFNIDTMQNSIDEIIMMAREENAVKMQHIESDKTDAEYQSSNKFYKEIEFLLPHVGPFQCKYCPKTLIDVYAYKFHISKHEGNKPFKCMQCQRELTHKKEFVCHLRRHTKECPYQCNACDKSFPSQKEWHRHVIKHGSKPYVCELCADSFYTQHQLTNHMKNHNNIRDHVCPECGKGFTHRGLLRQHLQTHNKTKCFCTLCDNIYSNPRSLRKHYVRVHESGQQPSTASKAQYNCQICKITFSTIQDAKQHRKEHKQSNPTERRHVCDICGHHFAYPRNLADHKKTHSNIRDQVCDICGKAFTNANLLNQHKNVHTGEKFVCKACGKDYAHYRGLCRHIAKVHGTNIRDLEASIEKQMIDLSPH